MCEKIFRRQGRQHPEACQTDCPMGARQTSLRCVKNFPAQARKFFRRQRRQHLRAYQKKFHSAYNKKISQRIQKKDTHHDPQSRAKPRLRLFLTQALLLKSGCLQQQTTPNSKYVDCGPRSKGTLVVSRGALVASRVKRHPENTFFARKKIIFTETYSDANFGRKLQTAKSMDTLVGRLNFLPTEHFEFSKMLILMLLANQKCKQRCQNTV